jgi:murein DD-endopeptidase MepM/ murein hydrolase activator NlpD
VHLGPIVLEKESATGVLSPGRSSHAPAGRFEESLREAQPAAPVAQSAEPARHVVQRGDTLTSIVQQALRARGQSGGASEVYEHTRRVAAHNGLRNPDKLQVGQSLDLGPLAGGVKAAASAPVTLPVEATPALPVPPVAAKAAEPARLAEERPAPRVRIQNRGKSFRHVSRDIQMPERPTALRMPDLERASADPNRPPVLEARDVSADGKGGPAPSQLAGLPMKHYRVPGNLVSAAWRAVRPGRHEHEASRAAHDAIPMGDAVAKAAQNGAPIAKPCHMEARITSGFGMRKDPFNGQPSFHRGVDLALKTGTDVYPVSEGIVKFSGWQAGYGRVVIVGHEDGTETLYAHNSTNVVTPGQRVTPDEVIAKSGSSGRSTGPHLHFEVRRDGRAIDPMPFLH